MLRWRDWRSHVYPLLGEDVPIVQPAVEELRSSFKRLETNNTACVEERDEDIKIAIASVAELMTIEESAAQDPRHHERTKTWRQHQLRVAAAEDIEIRSVQN